MDKALAAALSFVFVFTAGAAPAQVPASPPQASPGALRIREMCLGDIRRFCPDVQPGGGAIARCLRDHLSEVSLDCRTALAAARAQARARGEEQPSPSRPPGSPPQR